MNKPEIISFVDAHSNGEMVFREPVIIRLSPHDIGIKAYGLQVRDGQLIIHQDGGYVEWSYASEQVRNSIVQRLKLIRDEVNIGVHN